MHIQGMSSCAVQEIVSLASEGTPEKMMIRFCKQTIGLVEKGISTWNNGGVGEDGVSNKGYYTVGLGESYIFHGPVSSFGNSGPACKFAKFIKDKELGGLAEGKPVINNRYHPDHKCQVFIWNPDIPAVQAWWEAHKASQLKPKEPTAVEALEQHLEAAKKAMAPIADDIPF